MAGERGNNPISEGLFLFDEASSTQSVLYKNAKIFIIGSSGAGKSSLNMALSGEHVVSKMPTDKHLIRLLDRQEMQHEDGRRAIYEAFIWDMNSRSGYTLIHQLYLHDVVVALILLDTRNEADPIAGVRRWIQVVQRLRERHAVPMKIFLVIPRIDRGGSGIAANKLQELQEQKYFEGVFETSAREGRGIEELKQAILAAIDWSLLPAVSSTFIHEIKNFLFDKKQAGYQLCSEDELYTTFLHARAQTGILQNAETRAQFETCIELVEAQGLIRQLSFGKYILLQPELFDTYAAALLNEARNDPDAFGSIDEEQALQGRFTLAAALRMQDKGLEKILLSSIVKDFLHDEIAFSERADGHGKKTSLIFPSQSTHNNPNLPDPEEKLYIFYFEGMVEHLYTTLAVRLARSSDFAKKELWRNAITYRSLSGEQCGLSLHSNDEMHGELTVFMDTSTDKKTRYDFTSYVYWHLKTRGKLLHIEQMVICNVCKSSFTSKQVQRRRERNAHTIVCSVCETSVPLPPEDSFLTFSAHVQHIDRNADKQLRAEATAAEIKRRKELDDYDVLFCYNEDQDDKYEIKEICEELEKYGIVPWFEEIDLRPGSLRLQEIARQMQKVKAAAVCFGKEQTQPRWQEVQMNTLLNQSFSRGCTIIPVLLNYAPRTKPALPAFFDTRWVDFHYRKPNPIKQLLWGIDGKKRF